MCVEVGWRVCAVNAIGPRKVAQERFSLQHQVGLSGNALQDQICAAALGIMG